MSTPIRGNDAIKAMRDLFDAYLAECERIEDYKASISGTDYVPYAKDRFGIFDNERLEVFERRRDAIAAKLENKGFKVTAENGNDTLPSIAKAQAELNA